LAESNGFQPETELAKAKLLARTSSKVEKRERMFMLVLSEKIKNRPIDHRKVMYDLKVDSH